MLLSAVPIFPYDLQCHYVYLISPSSAIIYVCQKYFCFNSIPSSHWLRWTIDWLLSHVLMSSCKSCIFCSKNHWIISFKSCREKGIEFVAIDQDKSLKDQGPFDIVLHKVWAVTVSSFLSFLSRSSIGLTFSCCFFSCIYMVCLSIKMHFHYLSVFSSVLFFPS